MSAAVEQIGSIVFVSFHHAIHPDITFRMIVRCIVRGMNRSASTTSLFRSPATTLDFSPTIAWIPALATGRGRIINKRNAFVFRWPATAPKEVDVAPGDK